MLIKKQKQIKLKGVLKCHRETQKKERGLVATSVRA